ncbi:MAG: peptidoglycan DD-metalloendopeptidase family protein [Desulfobacterales bacterium]|uniref:Peptidoglycan DD-metalloendopeptidase family protein n=1 Tax=Candidatus Desulfaltia bathyphila TaxID=2841697 RepID=A0A8J6N6U7_9BACT|nr:peptidoglycan DD-metalloendopeptidase family protein [Candidatus Desulfaltia bathyphila]MBL7194976.1 peptidoglycan DD-metalloendopeptidase family protein [Desulfobacterales bacterium]MBL7208311.1 peptidoglycan DD-metalloendopeptidase family protein [Desulfobacterales bacterium]
MKNSHFISLGFIIFIAAGIVVLLHSAVAVGFQSNETGIVTASRLNVRPEPGTNKPPIKILKKGAKVTILARRNKWLKIRHDGQIGYVRYRKSYIRIVYDKAVENLSDVEAKIKTARQKTKDISRKLEKQGAEVQTFAEKEVAIIDSLNKADLALNIARKRVSVLRSELASLETDIQEATHAFNDLRKRIKTSEDYASNRLIAVYKLNLIGKMNILASAESINDFFQRKITMEHILAHDEKIWGKLVKNKDRLQRLLDKMNTQKTKKILLETDLNKRIDIMSNENEKRSKLLVDIQSKKRLGLAAIEALKQTAAALDRIIQSLGQSLSQMPNKVKNISHGAFSSFKGLLKMPVKGKIICFFGRHTNSQSKTVNFKTGIDIKADRGEPVYSVYDGQILYSRWFKGYGNMIIIDHGDHFCTVYAHAEELFKAKGDYVEAGEVIATVGDTGSMIGPKLYFELRHHGKPVNPLEWLKS